jgi:hypothetical protein
MGARIIFDRKNGTGWFNKYLLKVPEGIVGRFSDLVIKACPLYGSSDRNRTYIYWLTASRSTV